jgi:hypothetical protein
MVNEDVISMPDKWEYPILFYAMGVIADERIISS